MLMEQMVHKENANGIVHSLLQHVELWHALILLQEQVQPYVKEHSHHVSQMEQIVLPKLHALHIQLRLAVIQVELMDPVCSQHLHQPLQQLVQELVN